MKETIYIDAEMHNLDVSLEPIDKRIIDIEMEDINMLPLDINAYTSVQHVDIDVSTNEDIMFELKDYIGGTPGTIYTDNVYFKNDVTCAGEYTQVGNISKGIKDVKIVNTKGKTLSDFIKMIFTKELQPTKVEPSVSVSLTNKSEYEVGTKITPVYSASFNKGTYSYDNDTGVRVINWYVEDSNGNNSNKSSDTFSDFLITDNTNYSVKAIANHTEGIIAHTNLGNESDPIVKIASGSKNKTSSSITGYRSFFYGVLDNDDILTSSIPVSLAACIKIGISNSLRRLKQKNIN